MDYTNMLSSHKEKKISLNPEFANILNTASDRSEIIDRIKAMDSKPDHILVSPPALFVSETYENVDLFSSTVMMALRTCPASRRVIFLMRDNIQVKEEPRSIMVNFTKSSWLELSNSIANLFVKEPRAIGFELRWKRNTDGKEQGLELSLILPMDPGVNRASIVEEGLKEHTQVMEGMTIDESLLNEKKTNRPALISKALENSTFRPAFITFHPHR